MNHLKEQRGVVMVLELVLVALVMGLSVAAVCAAVRRQEASRAVAISSEPSPTPSSPGPSESYYLAVINKVGSPPGFTANPKTEEVQGGVGENLSVRRSYLGNGTFTQVRDYMLQGLLAVGFHNAAWRNANGLAVAAGILATCKGTAVFVRVDQTNDDPIDIQVWAANYPNAPNCPSL